jgi:hypothetical protein
MNKNKIVDRDSQNIPISSSVFYSNSLKNNNEERIDNLRNSIVDDQFDLFQKRNHYLRKSVVLIDSINREDNDNIRSNELNFNEIGFLMSDKYNGQIFLYLPQQPSLINNSLIYFQELTKIISNINNISSKILEFDPVNNSHIFNIVTVSNKTALNIFGWSNLSNLLMGKYISTENFENDTTNINFYSFFYTNNTNTAVNNYYTLLITKKPRVFQVIDRTIGYPNTSYFKIILGKSFNNIYKIKLLDINLPDVIFNINNDNYTINNYKYVVNSKLRIMIFDDQYLVSNIDYSGARIKYDFWQKEAVYDINGYNNNDYKFDVGNSKKYPHYYVANDIYQLLLNNLNTIDDTDFFLEYANNNIFEVAYFFLIQFNLYYNTDVFSYLNNDNNNYSEFFQKQRNPDVINRLFYIFTSDIISNTNPNNNFILWEDKDILNTKNPLIYFNDFLLYVNYETYNIGLRICNWMDKIRLIKNEFNPQTNRGFCDLYCMINNIDERIVGYIQDIVPDINNLITNRLYYFVSFYVLISNFNTNSIIGKNIYALYNSSSTTFVENTVNKYNSYNVIENTYQYEIFLDFGINLSEDTTTINNYNIINTDIFQYKSTVYQLITQQLISETILIQKTNYISYVLILDNVPSGFVQETIVGTTIYSRINTNSQIYIANYVKEYIGIITTGQNTAYAYKMYTNGQNSFINSSFINVLNGSTYTFIGNALSILDTYYTVKLTDDIPDFIEGTYYYTIDLSKQNCFLKKYDDSNCYLVAYSSIGLPNYRSYMFINSDKIYKKNIDTDVMIYVGTVDTSYEPIGTIEDVQFDLILDACIYKSDIVSYNVSTEDYILNPPSNLVLETVNFQKNIILPPIVSVRLDNIRIIETKTQTKYNVINYTNKTLRLNNNAGINYNTTILTQPVLDKLINMFIFRLSLKTPNINIGEIYTTQSFVGTIDSDIVGTGYSIYYAPKEYSIIVEKDDNFQTEYLQNCGLYVYTKQINSKFVEQYNFINRNYSYLNPKKTNMTGITNYNMIPYYEITLDSGSYNNFTFVNKLEERLNNINYQNFNYLKKTLETRDFTNTKINHPNYQQPRFKVLYNDTTKNIEIKSYKIVNSLFYKAYYNPISPYLYFVIKNTSIENNKRIYIEVLRDVANNNITNEVVKRLNIELTTRILSIFEYEVRIISPVPDLQYINTVSGENINIPYNVIDILRQTSLNPFHFRTNYPSFSEKMKYVGQTLKNMYNNSNSYTGGGSIKNNPGVPCNFIENELVIVINNLYYNYETYKIGRIINIKDKTSNNKGNYRLNIQLCGETKVSQPIFIGDIIYGTESETIACIVPYEWGSLTEFSDIARLHSGLPTEDIIRLGYKNYLKLLYKYSKRQYILDYIQNYSLESFVHYNSYLQDSENSDHYNINSVYNPFDNWPIQHVKNCHIGFEILFHFPVKFEISEKDIVLHFLNENQYCLYIGNNTNGVCDTPKDILGFNVNKILNMTDFSSKNDIPWNNTFDNNNNYDEHSINKMYITYGSDNIIQNKMYLELDDTSSYKIGDTVYINSLDVRPIDQRNIFDIYNSIILNVQRMFSFDMYLTFLAIRLSFIKSGIPISMGPNDYLGLLKNGPFSHLYMWQFFTMNIPNSLYTSVDTDEFLSFVNIIQTNFSNNLNYNNYNGLNENISHDLKNIPPLNSENISKDYAYIINNVILGKILPWFIHPDNLLLWTKGSVDDYFFILDTYIEISDKKIYRFELELLDSFFFRENLIVKDKNGTIIGTVTYNNLYKDSAPINNSIYILYINVSESYNLLENLIIRDYIYAEDMDVKSRIKTTPILITDTNKYIYLYDTYLKFKTIVQTVPDNSDTIQKNLNFNNINNIDSILMKLYNLDNQNLTSFKNGYYMSIAMNDIYMKNDSIIDGQYRIMINLLDNKNIFYICLKELGLINSFADIKDNIINMTVNSVKDIIQIRKLLDIFQLIVDLSPMNTVMIDLNFNQNLENNIHKSFEYQARLIENIFSICGSLNYYLENISYLDKYIYGIKNNPNANIYSVLNTYFSEIYTYDEVLLYKQTGTIEQNMCNLSNIYKKNEYGRNINKKLLIFKEPNNFIYGVIWVPIESGDRSIYIIVPAYSDDNNNPNDINKSIFLLNKNILDNYLITLNFIFVDQQKSIDIKNVEKNEMIQSNIIESITPVTHSNEVLSSNMIPEYTRDTSGNITSSRLTTYRIFKINLKFPVKYSVNRGQLIQIKDYYTTIYKQPDSKIKNKYKLYIQENWRSDKQFVLNTGYTIHINYGSYNPLYQKYIKNTNNFTDQLYSFDADDIVHEETNTIEKIGNQIEIDGKKYRELVMTKPIKYEFKSGLPIIICFNPQNNSSYTACKTTTSSYDVSFEVITDKISNNNDILTNGLATQNIIVNGEWYTKIFYQSEKNIDLYGISTSGIKSLNNLSSRQVYISGMKGYIVSNLGFQNIERNYYNSIEVNIEDNQNNTNIKPVPDGLYNLVFIQKEDNTSILDNIYDIPIPGYFDTIYNNNSPEQSDEWIDYYQNIRWYYAIEKGNNNILDLKNIDLYQYSDKYSETGNELQSVTIKFDKLCKVIKVENTGNSYKGSTIYKVYVILNIKNIINNFLYDKQVFNTKYAESTDYEEQLPYNTLLSTKDKGYILKIIYYGIRESVDQDYSKSLKPINYYSITIKGRYHGFGGCISLNSKNTVFNNIPYMITDINAKYNTIELDLNNNLNIYCSFYRYNSINISQNISNVYKQNYNKNPVNNTSINPAFSGFNQTPLQIDNLIFNENEIINYYDIFPSKLGYLANSGIVFKKKINQPVNTKIYDYIYLCFKNLESNTTVEQNNNIGNNIIFAKIYTKITDLNNFFIDYTNYEVIYDLNLISQLTELEVFFLDKSGNLVNFNNLDINFQLEIQEYVERVKNINTKNAMVF